MTTTEIVIIVGIALLITLLYFLLRKFVVWAIDDDQRWHKKKGNLGYSKESLEDRKKWALYRLTEGYAVVLVCILLLCLVKAGVIGE